MELVSVKELAKGKRTKCQIVSEPNAKIPPTKAEQKAALPFGTRSLANALKKGPMRGQWPSNSQE